MPERAARPAAGDTKIDQIARQDIRTGLRFDLKKSPRIWRPLQSPGAKAV